MWFEWLFKYPRQAYSQGELAFAGDLGVTWWVVAVVLLAASILANRRRSVFPLARRVPIHLLQAGAIAIILALIAEPVLQVTRLAPGANTVAVLVDTSKSMALPVGEDAADTETRLGLAKRLVARDVADAAGDSKIALFRFDDILRRVEDVDALVGGGEQSRLVDTLTDLATHYDQGALAAVIVLTDGAQNGGDGTVLESLAATGVPVHPVGIGPAAIPRDAELAEFSLPPRAGPNSEVVARLVIRHTDAGEIRVRVRDGESVLAAETVTLDPGTPSVTRDIAFSSGAPGLKEVTVELEPSAKDPLPGNNSRSVLLEVDRDRHRVLYLEGEPRWEFKFIRRAVAEDDDIELATWLRTTPRKSYRQGNVDPEELATGFPGSLEDLYRYDMIIIGSLPATTIDDEQHDWLASFVADRGGSLLVLAGRHALASGGWDVKPLAQTLPVVLERSPDPHAAPSYAARNFAARPTDDGMRSVLTDIGGDPGNREGSWETLPMLADYHRLGPLKVGATTLLEALGGVERRGSDTVVRGGAAEPLLVSQIYGYGRTAVLATASTWRWRMRTPPDDTRHSLFWRQLIRHFAGAALPQRRLSVAAEGDALNVRVALKNSRYEPVTTTELTARVTPPDGESFDVGLPRSANGAGFAETIPTSGPGIYRVDVAGIPGQPNAATRVMARDDDLRALARIGTSNLEQFGATLNEPLLNRLAESTGGRLWQPDDLAGLGDAIAFSGSGIQERQQLPLWSAPFLYLLLMLVKCTEWSLRRYWGGI